MLNNVLSSPKNINGEEKLMLAMTDINHIKFLYKRGWGTKRISKELGISRRTVKKYIKNEENKLSEKSRPKALDGLENWLAERYQKHRGNADVIRQELSSEHQIKVSLRTVERAVKSFRQADFSKTKATIRFETAPGKQMQIDFGSTHVQIGNQKTKIFLFVATLGFSRRLYVQPFLHERQNSWFSGIEGAFSHFNGLTQDVLLDNARALVTSHAIASKDVIFNDRLKAFAKYWGFNPIACRPYRARTKGKDERMVGYVKHNAIAGREFSSWADLVHHLQTWNANVADIRKHDTLERMPLEVFLKEEAMLLKPLPSLPSFNQIRELERSVHVDSCIEVDANYYTVPNRLIGQKVNVQLIDEEMLIFHNYQEVARHGILDGRRLRSLNIEHLQGIVGVAHITGSRTETSKINTSELQRPLSDYEQVVGGRW